MARPWRSTRTGRRCSARRRSSSSRRTSSSSTRAQRGGEGILVADGRRARRRRRRPRGSSRRVSPRRARRRSGPRGSGSRTPRRARDRRGTAAWCSSQALVSPPIGPGRITRARVAAGSRSTAASSAALSSPGAPASTRAASSSAARRRTRPTSAGRFLRRSTVPRASTYGRPSRSASHAAGGCAGGCVDGEWTEVDDLDARAPRRSRTAAAVAWLDACTVAPRCTRRRNTSPARRTSGDASAGLARNQQSYTDTSAGPAGSAARRSWCRGRPRRRRASDRPEDDPGATTPVRPRRRAAGVAWRWLRRGPEAEEVGEQLDAGVIAEGGDELGDGGADPGAAAVQRADVDGEANRVHAGWPTL